MYATKKGINKNIILIIEHPGLLSPMTDPLKHVSPIYDNPSRQST